MHSIMKAQTMFTIDGRFRFTQADSEDLKQAIYRLRYQIYVEEFGFEHAEDHPHGLECDLYDQHAIHFAALNEANQVVGTARLVLHSAHGFPIEHAAPLHIPAGKPLPHHAAELSRLAVSALYRRRLEDGQYGVESYLKVSEGGVLPNSGVIPPHYEQRQRPVIILGLCKMAWQASKRLGLTHWYAIAEKKLRSAFYRFGIIFHAIGEPVEYHGLRIPYLSALAEVEANLQRTNPSLYHMFLDGLEEEYHPQVYKVA